MGETKEIRIDEYIDKKETALVGRANGEGCLEKIEKVEGSLVSLEKNNTKIIFYVPKRILTINKSFFLGIIGLRICALGKEVFQEKYQFVASEYITSKIPKYIDDALRRSSMKDILDV